MNRRLRAALRVNVWLVLLVPALPLLGSGITLAALGKGPLAWLILGVSIILIFVTSWQLRQNASGPTLSLLEPHSRNDAFISTPAGRGSPNVVVFSGHMGLLIILKALKESARELVAVPAPGSDFRAIAGLLRTSHQDARVIPATAENAQLCARLANDDVIVGAANLEERTAGPIADLYLSSDGSTPASTNSWPLTQDLEEALSAADLFVFGPGSFFTSVVPALLLSRLREDISSSTSPVVFVCNVMTEPGRTDGWSVTDFISHFTRFAGFAPGFTIVNRSYPGSSMLSRYEVTGSYPIMVTPEEHIDASKVILGSRFPGSTTLSIGGSTVIEADIIEVATEGRMRHDPEHGTTTEHTVAVIRHDPEKLSRVLRTIVSQRRTQAPDG